MSCWPPNIHNKLLYLYIQRTKLITPPKWQTLVLVRNCMICCTYICMYVCVYVCMCVCVYVFTTKHGYLTKIYPCIYTNTAMTLCAMGHKKGKTGSSVLAFICSTYPQFLSPLPCNIHVYIRIIIVTCVCVRCSRNAIVRCYR